MTDSTHRFFGSDEAKARLGPIANLLPQWAGKDMLLLTRPDIVNNIDDLTTRIMIPQMPQTDRMLNSNAHIVMAQKQLPALIAAFDRASGRDPSFPKQDDVIESYGVGSLNEIKGKMAVHAALGLAHAGVIGNAGAEEAGPDAKCIIAAPPLNLDARGIASMLTGIPANKLRNIPGDAQAWNTVVFGHEAWHCRTYSLKEMVDPANGIKHETDADRFGLLQAFQQSADPAAAGKVAKAFIGMRALSLPNLMADTDHATSAFLQAPNAQTPLPAPGDIYDGGAGALEFIKKTAERIARDSHLLSDKPEDVLPIVQSHPELFYNAVNGLNKEGAYRGNPVAQTYADQFLDAARTYAPDQFIPGTPKGPGAPGRP